MKKFGILLAILVLFFSIANPPSSQASEVETDVDNLFQEMNAPGFPGAAVVVVKDGKVIFQKEYGLANIEYNLPITEETIFHIASISKHFTGFAIALLVDQGKISLEDDIRTYLPEVPEFKEVITIENLLHHTSGLRDQWELLGMAGIRLDDVITQEHILKIVSRQKELNNKPGAEIIYSSTNFTLLAEIVARASGQPFDEFVKENIFSPLKMDNSHIHINYREIVPNRAYPYLYESEANWEKGILSKGILSYANFGATSVFTNSNDMSKWLRNFSTRQVGNPAVWAIMETPGDTRISARTGYAAGLVISEYRGQPTIAHSGFDAGYRAYLRYFPNQKTGMAILGNYPLDTFGMIDDLADIFLADVLDPIPEEGESEPQTIPNKEKPFIPDIDLWEYTGAFFSEELETKYVVVKVNDQLIIRHWRNEDVLLSPVEEDIFSGNKWWIGGAVFVRDNQGVVTGLKVSTTGARNVFFTRIENISSFVQ